MISTFDDADEAISKTINSLCQKLDRIEHTDSPEFMPTVEAIAKLRASLNPVIHQAKE